MLEENEGDGVSPGLWRSLCPPATAAVSPDPQGSCPSRRDGGGSSVSGWDAAQPMRHHLGVYPPCPPVPERVSLCPPLPPPRMQPGPGRAGGGGRREEGGGRDGGALGAAAPEAEPRVPVPGRAQTSRCPLGHPVPLQPSRSTRPASSSSSSSTLGEALVSSSCGTGLVLAHTSCPPERSPGSAASQRVAGREYWQSHLALRVPKPGITPPSGLPCPGGPAGSGRERERERRTQRQAGNRQEPAVSRGPPAARGPRLSPPAPAR